MVSSQLVLERGGLALYRAKTMNVPVKATAKFFETVIDDEVVLMDIATGSFHSLQDSALAIWQHIDGARSIDKIVADLTEQYAVDADKCRADVSIFIGELEKSGFLALQ